MNLTRITIGLMAPTLCAALTMTAVRPAVASGAPAPAGSAAVQIRGGDVSSLNKSEDKGGVYRDAAGSPGDALRILRASGMNYARLKVWVDPADGYNDKAHVLETARRVKARGMGLLVDFHYSDSWADPGKQIKPAAWASYDVPRLTRAVYEHTHDVLSALKKQGTTAEMVQIGNEINGGMLWPEGSTSNFDNLAAFLTSGYAAAKAVSKSTKVVLHLAEGGDTEGARWWFDQAVARKVPFDVIGLSHYVYWHGSLSLLRRTLNEMAARYRKNVLVAETAYGFTLDQGDATANIFDSALQQAGGYPATPQGQTAALRDVFAAVAAVPGGRGLGVFYWEPTWTAVPGNGWDPADPDSGNGWENQALFDYTGKVLPAADVYGSG